MICLCGNWDFGRIGGLGGLSVFCLTANGQVPPLCVSQIYDAQGQEAALLHSFAGAGLELDSAFAPLFVLL